jgi:DNA-directed RNA polymerase specialized sigma24 family protein
MSNQREQEALFAVRFSRCYRWLQFIAYRVLGGTERADEAIERCRLRSSLNPPQFEYEGAFRSWLLRVLIDEAVAVLRRSQEEAGYDIGRETELEPAASCVTDRHLSSSVNSLLVDPHEFSSESPQRFHSVLAVAGATIETQSGETLRMSVAKYRLSS